MMQSCHFYIFVLVIITDLFPPLVTAIVFRWGRLDAECVQSSNKLLDVLK